MPAPFRLGFALGLVLALATVVGIPPAAAQQQSSDQRRCIQRLNRDVSRVARAQARVIQGCLRDASRGALAGGVEACIDSDPRGSVQAAIDRTLADVLRSCSVPPDFGPSDGATIAQAGIDQEKDLVHDLFGPDLDAGVVLDRLTDGAGAVCQRLALSRVTSCERARHTAFLTCKRDGLRTGGIVGAAGLEACQGADPRGRIARACDPASGRLAAAVGQCVARGADLAAAFPGCATSDPDALSDCLAQAAACRSCLAIDQADGLASDCDLVDDGAPNGSCGALVDTTDLTFLASDALAGRNNGTQGSTDAQNFLIDELLALGAVGLDAGQAGRDAFLQAFPAGTNVLGLIPGQDPTAYVMVGAHYDHLTSCAGAGPGDTICNGATDNATGVAATLAIARRLASAPTPPARSVILAFWDREEDGLLGSAHYVNNPLVPLAATVGYVNFDIQGANLSPSLRNFSAAVGPETGGAVLRALLDDAVAGEGLATRPLSYIFGQLRSDYVNLVNAGVPTIFFSDSTGGCYHTVDDEIGVVDFGKLETQTRIALKLTQGLIDAPAVPFVPPSPSLATFEDATVILDVVNQSVVDLPLFSPADQAFVLNFQAQLAAIVADGAAAFDPGDVATLLGGVAQVIDILTRQPCDGFLVP